MDILRLLDELNTLAIESPRTFGPICWGLNKDEISMQIAKIRASLPQELKNAASNVKESERIILSAKEDGERIVEQSTKEAERILSEAKLEVARLIDQAKLQQEAMISESEILKLSKAQCEEIRNAAERDAIQVRRGADKYAVDVLTHIETVLGKTMASIERGKHEIERIETSQPTNREKVRA